MGHFIELVHIIQYNHLPLRILSKNHLFQVFFKPSNSLVEGLFLCELLLWVFHIAPDSKPVLNTAK